MVSRTAAKFSGISEVINISFDLSFFEQAMTIIKANMKVNLILYALMRIQLVYKN